ncbi:MAG TPA: WD40 repeat domain-containing protein [Candidatus Babeliales bacterium]|nr:WD40 repeat domain-containing protein [Candidatus Babeliales bacterium]
MSFRRGLIQKWNTQDWTGVQKVARDAKYRRISITLAPDGSYAAGIPHVVERGVETPVVPVIWKLDVIEDKNPTKLNLPKKNYHSVLFSPDGNFLACRSSDDVVTIMHKVKNRWGKIEWRQLTELIIHRGDHISSMSFSSDGSYFACGTSEGVVRVYATNGWKEITRYTLRNKISSMAFSSDNRYLAVGFSGDKASGIDVRRVERK